MCKCCEKINFYKNHINIIDKNRFKDKMFAKISIYTWQKEERAIKGNECSTIISKAFDLNYCPMCGKKVR